MTEPATADAYALLSKPTPELTDAEVEIVVAELRKKREAFLAGSKDTAAAKPKAKAPAATTESKKANTADLLAALKGGI